MLITYFFNFFSAYTRREVEQIQKWASDNDMIVIPLVQTFGNILDLSIVSL